ncbi:MAG TPA: cytochrome P460 family protein, partial [bacterium]
KGWLFEATAWLWILTFLSSLAAGITGHLFSMHLGLEPNFTLIPPETVLKGVLQEHVLWAGGAILVSAVALVAAIKTLRQKPWSQGIQLVLGFSLAVLFGITGHEGGQMVFGASETPMVFTFNSSSSTSLLDQVAHYQRDFVKMNSRMWNSRTHGHRWVNTYVSKDAVLAYKNSNPTPEGALVVKESFENKEGQPSAVYGPLYVMAKGKVSDSAEIGGWQFALIWDHPASGNPENITHPVKWLPGDAHLASCVKCHNHFKATDYVGGIPEGYENH